MCWWKWVNGVVLVLDVRVHSRCLRVCVCVCGYVESEGKEEGGWKERRKRKEKKVKKRTVSSNALVMGARMCVAAPCLFFLGEAGRAFSLKKIGAPARRAARGECTREREVVFSFSSF